MTIRLILLRVIEKEKCTKNTFKFYCLFFVVVFFCSRLWFYKLAIQTCFLNFLSNCVYIPSLRNVINEYRTQRCHHLLLWLIKHWPTEISWRQSNNTLSSDLFALAFYCWYWYRVTREKKAKLFMHIFIIDAKYLCFYTEYLAFSWREP